MVPTTGPKHPRAGAAGPTQDSHGQQPCHFIQRSGTHSHTRFGAPVRAARVGGAKAAPLHSPWALQFQWALNDPGLSPVRADLGRWRCAEESRAAAAAAAQKPLLTLNFRGYVCVCMCMYMYVCVYICVCMCMYLMYIYTQHAVHASSVPAQVIACMCMYVYV